MVVIVTDTDVVGHGRIETLAMASNFSHTTTYEYIISERNRILSLITRICAHR